MARQIIDKKKRVAPVSVAIDPLTLEQLDKLAERKGVSRSRLIREGLKILLKLAG